MTDTTAAVAPADEGPASPFPSSVSHSHDNARLAEEFEVRSVTCAHCSKSQAFTVPRSHNGTKITWTCNGCEKDNRTDGTEPAAAQPAGTLPQVPCLSCGRPLAFTAAGEQKCPSCGTVNVLSVVASGDSGAAAEKAAAS